MAADASKQASKVRIGLRVISSPGWRGGVNYIVNWARACAGVPLEERPEVWLLPYDTAGGEIAAGLSGLVAGIHPFARAAELDLDMVYPATQVFEAPFDAPWAAWIPDWQCKHLPELFDEAEIMRRDLHYGLLATRAPYLALSSGMAIDDSQRLFAGRLVPHTQLSFPSVFDPAEVASAREVFPDVSRHYDLPETYFLVANQWWRHKNHALLIEALSQLDDSVVVVCTGDTRDHRWPDYPRDMLNSEAVRALGARLRVLGSVDRQSQLALMLEAKAIIQPSRFEGWSTIVEEARALNLPLIVSRIPVHEEQSPPGCVFFDVDDANGLAAAMRERLAAPRHVPTDINAAQDRYIRSCVAQLSAMAREVKRLYQPAAHDPARLLAELVASLPAEPASPAEQAVVEKVLSGARAMLAGSPAAIPRFLAAVAGHYPDRLALLKSRVARPAYMQARISGMHGGGILKRLSWLRRLWAAFRR